MLVSSYYMLPHVLHPRRSSVSFPFTDTPTYNAISIIQLNGKKRNRKISCLRKYSLIVEIICNQTMAVLK